MAKYGCKCGRISQKGLFFICGRMLKSHLKNKNKASYINKHTHTQNKKQIKNTGMKHGNHT